ncbi:MAG: hypothetical protein OSJ73_22790 [Lachnospiraceae bacterium]|jgi:hypothetical protein|nr:hypothetical protein [Lachnospiraceae bacterium]
MTGINVNVKEIFRKFGLQARKIEPVVYEILNTSKEVSIDELQWELEECVLITSDRIRSRKLESGIYTTIAYVYYVILDYDSDVCYEYDNIATDRFGESLVMPYKYSPAAYHEIDTIYAKGE